MPAVVQGPVGVEPALDFPQVVKPDELLCDLHWAVLLVQLLVSAEGLPQEEQAFGEGELWEL